MKHDAMMIVRMNILNRIDGIAAQRGHITLARVCEEVDGIRHLARTYGLEAVERLASTLGTALALDGHGPVVLSYLDLRRDAADCQDAGPDVVTTIQAAAALRLGA